MGAARVILLDTNYLIGALVAGSREAKRVSAWLRSEEDLCTSAVSWFEFSCGPVDAEGVDLVSALLRGRVLPFTGEHASEASRLWNATGRPRRLRVDAMIAGAAVAAGARLATANLGDFEPFERFGLRLV